LALEEDLGRGDVTSEAVLDSIVLAKGTIVAKQKLVIAGLDVARAVFARVDPQVRLDIGEEIFDLGDGTEVEAGDTIASVYGWARSLLAAERTALNFLQRLSGIATLTRAFVGAVEGTRATIVDTRKT